jgi:hypothetical protein
VSNTLSTTLLRTASVADSRPLADRLARPRDCRLRRILAAQPTLTTPAIEIAPRLAPPLVP